jgi:glutamate N-acetyltransferase/amino-acid N-acetyltransferase
VSVTAADGFLAAGIHCGIKPSGALDLALVATVDGRSVPAAAVFTANKMTAAPVLVTRAHLAMTGGRAAAVILNSGNANAATGATGRGNAERMAAAVAAPLGCAPADVLVCSTGLIGIPLPIDVIEAGAPALAAARRADGATDAAEAIRTTDTHRKDVVVDGGGFTVGGMAKGAAMLAPNMATMLAVLTTDAAVEAAALQSHLRHAVTGSFNGITVDGCQSTNDTVIVLASGEAGAPSDDSFGKALAEACAVLARQMVGDAEGATKVVTVRVTGATNDVDARRAARQIAESQLVKCSWFGCDPYWGRIASEVGASGIEFDPDRLTVRYGGIDVCRGGVAVAHDEPAVAAHMAGRELVVEARLGLGDGYAQVLTNDLSHAYVDENKGTS